MADDRTVVVETPERSGGGSGWIIALVLVVALIVGIVFFSQVSNTQSAKDNAITNAAHDVGNAAKDVGNAAQSAGNAVQNGGNGGNGGNNGGK